jgi:hypothetical protein
MTTLDDLMLERMGREIACDIDRQVLMTALGWHSYELKVSEGTVYSSRYLTVHPTNSEHWNEMMQWMLDRFGPSSSDGVWTPDQRWYANNAKFWFRDPKDLTLFLLRWSSP